MKLEKQKIAFCIEVISGGLAKLKELMSVGEQ